MRLAGLCFLVVLLTACQSAGPPQASPVTTTDDGTATSSVASTVQPEQGAGLDLPERVVVRDYYDRFRIDGEDHPRRVIYLWDYGLRSAVERIETLDGELVSEQAQPGLTLNLSDEELEVAFELVRRDAVLGPQARAQGVELFGGFSFMQADDPGCGLGSRCTHVMGPLDGGPRMVLHAIVDLQTRRIIHPHYAPERVTPLDPRALRESKRNEP